jgi:hypothetical protein
MAGDERESMDLPEQMGPCCDANFRPVCGSGKDADSASENPPITKTLGKIDQYLWMIFNARGMTNEERDK